MQSGTPGNQCQPAWGRQWGITEPSPTACSKSQHAWLQWPVHSRQNEDASLVSEMAGSWRAAVFHESANVVSSGWSKSASAFDLFLQKNSQSVFMWNVPWTPALGAFHPAPASASPSPREIYWKMNDRDRTAPSPWLSCFLIWDCKKAHPPEWTIEQL